MAEVKISSELVEEAMNKPVVREGLRQVAEMVAAQTNAIGSSEGVDMDATVRDLVRPKGRPESRVESGQVDQEWGTSKTAKRRIMGRAAESVSGTVGVQTEGAADRGR